jgi:hypothetical protein
MGLALEGPDEFVAIMLSAAFIFCLPSRLDARESSAFARAAAGRELALRVCTGCHIVSPDQPFGPVIARVPPPPDFHTIANMPNTTPASLRRFFSTLRPVPAPSHMADPYLRRDERENIIAFIMTLKGPR